jgi:hypothetical protein
LRRCNFGAWYAGVLIDLSGGDALRAAHGVLLTKLHADRSVNLDILGDFDTAAAATMDL